jgi:lysophospholipase L1-like esterase
MTMTHAYRSSRGSGTGPRYYLSLGDSLSRGVQPIGPEELQFRTNEGFADQLYELARDGLPDLALVNLGYPGESTSTMLDGSLCAYPHGSQLGEAVAFLEAHPGEIAFVTIDVGGNDFPVQDLDGLAVGLEAIGRNLPGIVRSLREAAGPETLIAGMTLYDPMLASWLEGADGRELAQQSADLGIQPINASLTSIYNDAGIAVADVGGAFDTFDFETRVLLGNVGEVPLNVARILEWTWAGAAPPLGPDPHPNARGYRIIAETYARALSGLGALPRGWWVRTLDTTPAGLAAGWSRLSAKQR